MYTQLLGPNTIDINDRHMFSHFFLQEFWFVLYGHTVTKDYIIAETEKDKKKKKSVKEEFEDEIPKKKKKKGAPEE